MLDLALAGKLLSSQSCGAQRQSLRPLQEKRLAKVRGAVAGKMSVALGYYCIELRSRAPSRAAPACVPWMPCRGAASFGAGSRRLSCIAASGRLCPPANGYTVRSVSGGDGKKARLRASPRLLQGRMRHGKRWQQATQLSRKPNSLLLLFALTAPAMR